MGKEKDETPYWIAIDVVMILYAVILFLYGKYFRKRDAIVFVNNNII